MLRTWAAPGIMTEAEWLACQKLSPMMTFLRRRGSERKFYLAGCAGVRLVWDQVTEEACRRCVETAERYADGEVDFNELARVYRHGDQFSFAMLPAPGPRRTQAHRNYAAMRGAVFAAMHGAYEAGFSAMHEAARAGKRGDLWARQCDLLRDIFRPFRPISLDKSMLTPTITRLAEAAYAERDPRHGWLDAGRLAVLADALEEAGCTAEELLEHLRRPSGHVRGCWALDLILGKK
jgi:hypothetical protein